MPLDVTNQLSVTKKRPSKAISGEMSIAEYSQYRRDGDKKDSSILSYLDSGSGDMPTPSAQAEVID